VYIKNPRTGQNIKKNILWPELKKKHLTAIIAGVFL